MYEFFLGLTAAERYQNLYQLFVIKPRCEHTCELWFNRFKARPFLIEDEPATGRLVELEKQELLNLLATEHEMNTPKMVSKLGCSHYTIIKYLTELDFVQKLGA